MIFLYSYTIFCAFFLFGLDHTDDFCFIHKFHIKKILSCYFIFQLTVFFIQFLSFYNFKYLNINKYGSFISRLTEVISFGYIAYIIDYFWLENRLKLKKKIIYYIIIMSITEFTCFITRDFTKEFIVYFHLAERLFNLLLFLIIIFYMIIMFKKIRIYYVILYICMLSTSISAIAIDNSGIIDNSIINFTFGILAMLIFVKFYTDTIRTNRNKLSKKDIEIINGVLNNLSNNELAAKFNIAESTVKNRLNRIYKILEINTPSHEKLIDKYKRMKS